MLPPTYHLTKGANSSFQASAYGTDAAGAASLKFPNARSDVVHWVFLSCLAMSRLHSLSWCICLQDIPDAYAFVTDVFFKYLVQTQKHAGCGCSCPSTSHLCAHNNAAACMQASSCSPLSVLRLARPSSQTPFCVHRRQAAACQRTLARVGLNPLSKHQRCASARRPCQQPGHRLQDLFLPGRERVPV